MSDVFGAGQAVSGAAQAAGALGAAAIQADAAKSAAKMQVDSANRSADLVQGRYDTTRGDFAPYRDLGAQAAGDLGNRLDALTSTDNPFASQFAAASPNAMTQAGLASTPGYKFTLSQGLEATQNSAAARGLGVSGAALKGAASYATGLSDQTYNTRFNQQQQLFNNVQTQYTNDQGQKQNAFNRLSGITGIGQASAGQVGALGAQAANAAGGYLTGGAAAAGAGVIAGGNAAAGAINGVTNAFTQYQQMNRLYGDQSGAYGSGGVGAGGNTLQYQGDANYNSENGY